jgi:hypothetical protein
MKKRTLYKLYYYETFECTHDYFISHDKDMLEKLADEYNKAEGFMLGHYGVTELPPVVDKIDLKFSFEFYYHKDEKVLELWNSSPCTNTEFDGNDEYVTDENREYILCVFTTSGDSYDECLEKAKEEVRKLFGDFVYKTHDDYLLGD